MSDLLGTGSKNRWYPNSISSLKEHLCGYNVNQELCPHHRLIISNITYNLQYIEYLRKTLNELNLSDVIKVQTIKSFIVISTSIIEAIFFIICINEKLFSNSNWKEFKTVGSSEFDINQESYKSETKIWIKSANNDLENIKFEQMIKKIESKKVLDIESQFFKDLNQLRKLRNKIHLQEVKTITKTDYETFWVKDYFLSKKNLRLLLISSIFEGEHFKAELFDFLKI